MRTPSVDPKEWRRTVVCGVETAGQLEVTHAGLTGTHRALGRLLPGAGAVVADQGAVSEGLPVVGHQDGVGQAAVVRLGRDQVDYNSCGTSGPQWTCCVQA